MRKDELKREVLRALSEVGSGITDHTPADQTEYFDFEIRHESLPHGKILARFFIWELTPDRSSSGRPSGEHKLQLTLGNRSDSRHTFPSRPGYHNFLLGYSQTYGLFVGFQIDLHENFPWSKLVACRDDVLSQARTTGWSTHLRGRSRATGQQEVAIAFKPARIVDWLRFQINHPSGYGPSRQSAANAWSVSAFLPIPSIVPHIEAIDEEEIPPASAEEAIREGENLSAIFGAIEISSTADRITVDVNVAERIEATNRHNEIIRQMNNRAEHVFGDDAYVIDRDLPGHSRSQTGLTVRLDLGLRCPTDNRPQYYIAEAKSLPTEAAGQWRQIMVGVGELARYSEIYTRRFDERPVRILALEFLPADQELQRFLQALKDNEDVYVVWREGDGFRTFSSHHEDISWLAEME